MKLTTLDIISAIINSIKFANIERYNKLKKSVVLVNKLTHKLKGNYIFTATTATLIKDIGKIGLSESANDYYKSTEIIRTMPEIIPMQYEIADIILQLSECLNDSCSYELKQLKPEVEIICVVEEFLKVKNFNILREKMCYNQKIINELEKLLNKNYMKLMLNEKTEYLDNLFYRVLRKSNVYLLDVEGVVEEQFLNTIASIIDAQHEYTAGHTKRVANYSYVIGEHLGYNEKRLRELRYASYLHDIGKLAVTSKILDKPSQLSLEEFEKIKRHAEYSYKILEDSPTLKNISYGALHHERIDGKGYPFGLKGDEIPEEAKIIAIADVLDALTSNRPYRKPITFEHAFNIMERTMVGVSLDQKIFYLAKSIF